MDQEVYEKYFGLAYNSKERFCNYWHQIKEVIPLSKIKKQIHNFDKEHYWEIGKAEYPLSKIINNIEKIGFKIERTYRPFEAPNSRFFILVKRI